MPSPSLKHCAAAQTADAVTPRSQSWLADFHAGDRRTLENCYREYYQTVLRAIRRCGVGDVDEEALLQEVFLSLLRNRRMRQGFQGGSFSAWIATVARNRVHDYRRRQDRARRLSGEIATHVHGSVPYEQSNRTHALRVLERFARESLPSKWGEVFQLRFVRQLTQEEAARQLGMRRTTLVYQEKQIRTLLRDFVLGQGDR